MERLFSLLEALDQPTNPPTHQPSCGHHPPTTNPPTNPPPNKEN